MERIGGRSESAIGPIAGGFVLVKADDLMAAWRACRASPLGVADFRAWLACAELRARRQAAEVSRAPSYTFEELAGLLGVAQKRARASVHRLVQAGLLDWSDHAVEFPVPTAEAAQPALVETIGRGRGSVAIPRRMLRFLAKGGRAALIATAIGSLLRCLSRRRRGFDGRGRVKASWIARAFEVDLSRIKLARAELVELGWLLPLPSDQWAMNRWGKAYRITLDWDRPTSDGRRSLPPPTADGPKSPPPDLHQDPLRGRIQHQEPGPAGPAGVKTEGSGEGVRPEIASGSSRLVAEMESPTPAPTLAAPKLADVRVEDLKDVGRLLDLFGQAVAARLVGPSEADRLAFVSLAEHALAVGRGNPPGLFAYLVRGACRRYITQQDEDRANVRIKAFLRGPEIPRAAPSPPRLSARLPLSADVRMVIQVRSAMASAKYRGDPFPQVRRHDPSWTRERWDRALAELNGTST